MGMENKGLIRIHGLIQIKARLRRRIVSCNKRHSIFGHCLITGLGGTGKTLLARAIAEELNYNFIEIEAAALNSREALIRHFLSSIKKSQTKTLLYFIDECHRLTDSCQETLYYPMEENRIITQEGDIIFPPFCLFGATTQPQLLDQSSLVSRFERGMKINLDRYSDVDLQEILIFLFRDMGLDYDIDVIRAISKRCLGIPRNARNLAEKIRDHIIFRGGSQTIMLSDVNEVMFLEGLDDLGLNELQVKLLQMLLDAKGRTRSLGMLAARLNMSKVALQETIEPVLLSLGFIDINQKGRIITEQGYQHLMKNILC